MSLIYIYNNHIHHKSHLDPRRPGGRLHSFVVHAVSVLCPYCAAEVFARATTVVYLIHVLVPVLEYGHSRVFR